MPDAARGNVTEGVEGVEVLQVADENGKMGMIESNKRACSAVKVPAYAMSDWQELSKRPNACQGLLCTS